MKKYILFLTLFIVIGFPLFWWGDQSSLPNGVHLEKQAGSIVIPVEEHELTAPFRIPVTWVKIFPWEKPPVIEDLVLLDESGEEIANIQGKTRIEGTLFQSPKWYDREIKEELVFEVNANKKMETSGFTVTPFSDTLKELYIPSELQLTYKDNKLLFSFNNKLKIFPIKQNKTLERPAWETQALFYDFIEDGNKIKRTGLFLEVYGQLDSKIEEILFWLPGMPEDYYENYVQYTFDQVAIERAKNSTPFSGEKLSLPLEIDSSHLLLYFPFTEEIISSIGDSSIYLMPYLKTIDSSGSVYYHGGSGSIGPLNDREGNMPSMLIK